MFRFRTHTPFLLPFLVLACAPAGHRLPPSASEDGSETPSRPVTAWSAAYEIFAEHDLPLPGAPAAYAVHVTHLADGAPQTEGALLQRFRLGDRTVEARSEAPARPGVHLGEFTLPAAGEWSWEVIVGGGTIVMPAVEVATDAAARARIAASLEEPSGITMLKEQQWPIRLRTAPVGERPLADRVGLLVQVEAPPGADSILRAPVSGIVSGLSARRWPECGQPIEGGAVIGFLRIPAAGAEAAAIGGWKTELEAARREAEQGLIAAEAALAGASARLEQADHQERRIAVLLGSDSASPREHEEALLTSRLAAADLAAAEAARAGWQRSVARLDNLHGAADAGDPWSVELFAARAGTVVDVFAAPGEWVAAGAPLLRVVDGERLLLAAQVPITQDGALAGASLRLVLPDGGELELPGPGGRLLLHDAPADPATRTRPLVFECAAVGGLRAGAVLRGSLALGAARNVVAAPAAAIVDEDGIPAVYVHAAGETFVKRLVRVGARDGGWVEIREGLAVGERVVVDGAPVVRLVSLSGAIPEHSH